MPALEIRKNNFINSIHTANHHYELIHKEGGYIQEYIRTITDLIEYASFSGEYKRPCFYCIRITPSAGFDGKKYTKIIDALITKLSAGNPLHFSKVESNTTQDGLHFHMALVLDRDYVSPSALLSALKTLIKEDLIKCHYVSKGSDHKLNLMYPIGASALTNINKTSIELYPTKNKPNLIANAVYLAGYIAKVDTSVYKADIGFQAVRTNFKAYMKSHLQNNGILKAS